MAWIDLMLADSLALEETRGFAPAGVPVALFRLDDGYFALHDLCPHGHARLSEGYVDDVCVECPLHQGLVDIRTGEPRAAPISQPVKTYPVRVVDGMVQVDV